MEQKIDWFTYDGWATLDMGGRLIPVLMSGGMIGCTAIARTTGQTCRQWIDAQCWTWVDRDCQPPRHPKTVGFLDTVRNSPRILGGYCGTHENHPPLEWTAPSHGEMIALGLVES
jgi:hypothetical protein